MPAIAALRIGDQAGRLRRCVGLYAAEPRRRPRLPYKVGADREQQPAGRFRCLVTRASGGRRGIFACRASSRSLPSNLENLRDPAPRALAVPAYLAIVSVLVLPIATAGMQAAQQHGRRGRLVLYRCSRTTTACSRCSPTSVVFLSPPRPAWSSSPGRLRPWSATIS